MSDRIPFDLIDGWPKAIPDCSVVPDESGIIIGSFPLDDRQRAWVASRPRVLSLRIDDHGGEERYEDPEPNSGDSIVRPPLTIPLQPVELPPETTGAELALWVCDTHGTDGRLLLWDSTETWWLVNDAALELMVVCAPPGCPLLPEVGEAYALARNPHELLPEAREQVAMLRRAYNLPAPANPTN